MSFSARPAAPNAPDGAVQRDRDAEEQRDRHRAAGLDGLRQQGLDGVGHLGGGAVVAGVVDGLRDERAVAEQAEQRDADEQRRKQRHHHVVRQRGGAVGHLVGLELLERLLELVDHCEAGSPRERADNRRAATRRASLGVIGQQRVAVGDGVRELDDAAVGAARLLAHELERLALVDAVALHEDPLGALDRAAPLQRALELLDLLDELRLLGVALS